MRITVTSGNERGEREIATDYPDIPFDYTVMVTTTTHLIALLKASEGGGGGWGGDYEAPVEPPPVPVNRFNPVFN